MTLDPLLIDVLACPEDKGPLLYFADEDRLYNPRLHRSYEVRDGIPVMLIDEATAGRRGRARPPGGQGRRRRCRVDRRARTVVTARDGATATPPTRRHWPSTPSTCGRPPPASPSRWPRR